MTSTPQRVRCPCCNEVFVLTDEMLVAEQPAVSAQLALIQPVDAPATTPAPTQTAKQATEQPVKPARTTTKPKPAANQAKLIFDGGSIGNPGRGYGSYQLTIGGKKEPPQRIEFPGSYTNNEAEYDTLLNALDVLLQRFDDPSQVALDIRGDSQLVINQINGTWKAKDPRMQQRRDRIKTLLARFGSWQATWHDRSKSVRALGH